MISSTLLTLEVSETKIAKFANSRDVDEVAHNEPSHLDLHHLPSSLNSQHDTALIDLILFLNWLAYILPSAFCALRVKVILEERRGQRGLRSALISAHLDKLNHFRILIVMILNSEDPPDCLDLQAVLNQTCLHIPRQIPFPVQGSYLHIHCRFFLGHGAK